MDIAFLGGLFPDTLRKEILENSIGVVQNAADALQWNLVRGLDAQEGAELTIINSLYIGSYPKRYRKVHIEESSFSHNGIAKDINAPFWNLPVVKELSRYHNLKPYLKAWALNGKKDKAIMAYAMTGTFTRALKYVKKLNPDIVTCLIVPDLPVYMDISGNAGRLYKMLKSVEIRMITRNMQWIDKYVVLTEQMAQYLNVQDYLVVEGIATESSFSEPPRHAADTTIVYTGTLQKKYGVWNLVEAVQKMRHKEYSLVICGNGDTQEQIQAEAAKDSRIKYLGQLPREEILEIQKNADILVNPRPANEEYTKYSFPSKNLEYLSAGRPVVAYCLEGIPKEYGGYIRFVGGDRIEDLAEALDALCDLTEEARMQIGQRGQRFVAENKNAAAQCRRIVQFLRRRKNEKKGS